VDASFFVRAQEAGAQVPIHLDIAYNAVGQQHYSTTTRTVSVRSRTPTGAAPQNRVPSVKILFSGSIP
jgi:hypothetical protein